MLFVCLAVATASAADLQRYDYRLLRLQKVSKMEQKMNEAAADGYAFQALLERNGRELMLVMEKALDGEAHDKKYKLLSTSKTSTMQKELQEAGEAGFRVLEITVAETSFWGGHELVCILVKED